MENKMEEETNNKENEEDQRVKNTEEDEENDDYDWEEDWLNDNSTGSSSGSGDSAVSSKTRVPGIIQDYMHKKSLENSIRQTTGVEDNGLVELASQNIKSEFTEKIKDIGSEIYSDGKVKIRSKEELHSVLSQSFREVFGESPNSSQDGEESSGVKLPQSPTSEEVVNRTKDWVNKVEKEEPSIREKARRLLNLISDRIRIYRNKTPETEDGKKIVEEEVQDLKRLGRLKEFVKNNKLFLGAVIVSVGSIITAIIMGTRRSVKKSSHAAKTLASELKKYLKNFNPIIQNAFGLVASALVLGAKGLEFLAENLALASILITIYINF